MSYTGKKYNHDVFMSFSHGDMKLHGKEPHLRTWTYTFVERLKEEIMLSLGSEKEGFNIWYDAELEGNQALTPELKKRVEESALLLIIMTPQYLDSSWCKDEMEWFESELQRRGEDVESIFVVRALHTEEARWPAIFKGEYDSKVLGATFYDTPGDSSTRPYGWPKPSDEDSSFFEALPKLAGSIIKRLKDLRTMQLEMNTPPPTDGRCIYLACGTDDVVPDQKRLRQLLGEQGISVAPESHSTNLEAIPAEFDGELNNCDLYVQLFGFTSGHWNRNPSAPVIYQYENAQKIPIPVMTWRQPKIPIELVQDESYRQLIERSEPSRAVDMEALTVEIIQALDDHVSSSNDDAPIAVYLDAPPDAEQKRSDIQKYLEQSNCLVFPISHQPVDGDLNKILAAWKERVTLYLQCDAVVLLHTENSVWIESYVLFMLKDRKLRRELRALGRKMRCAVLDLMDEPNFSLDKFDIDVLHWNPKDLRNNFNRWVKESASSKESDQ